MTKSAEERAARAAKRSLTKEAPAVKEPLSKRARLDSSSNDLINLLTTSAPVSDIFAASGSRHLPREAEVSALGKGALMDVSYELDHLLLVASPASASVLDIMTASGSRTLPNQAFAEVLSEDDQTGGSKKEAGYELDGLPNEAFAPLSDIFAASGSKHLPREAQEFSYELDHQIGASPASASVLDIMTASGTWTLLNEAFAEDFSEDDQTGGSKKELDALVGSLLGCEPASASVLDISSGSSALPREAFAQDEKAVE